MQTAILSSPLSSPLQTAVRSPIAAGGVPETFYLLDELGNILTDEAGNRLIWS